MVRVGQNVVCVDASNCWDQKLAGVRAAIREGGIYTIRWIGEHNGSICIRLAGIKRHHLIEPDYPFSIDRFRPLVERKTDISALQALLVPGSKILEVA